MPGHGAPTSRAAAPAGAATSTSRRRRARHRASPSAGCRARRAGSRCSLKLLADVGLVGLPNAGKSSLLARLTRARAEDRRLSVHHARAGASARSTATSASSSLADIPGLIEGASDGAGLGHEFLAHVERTRLLVHVLDLAPERTASDPAENYATIEHELAAHDARLAGLPRVLALSKVDLVTPEAAPRPWRVWRERLGPEVSRCSATSSATGQAARHELRARGSLRARRPSQDARRRWQPRPTPRGDRRARVFRPAAAHAASTSSSSGHGRSRQRHAASSACVRATTSRTTRRWPTSRPPAGDRRDPALEAAASSRRRRRDRRRRVRARPGE